MTQYDVVIIGGGPGGYNAVRGHGGLPARVLPGGEVHIGATIERLTG